MDCILKIIAGPETGQSHTCSGPETYLGRSQRCLIRLSAPSVSFEHALITRVGDDFFIENLSANGTLLNHARLAAKTRLRQIQLGTDTVARVAPLPAASAAGTNRRWLLVAFVLMLLAALVIVIVDPFSSTSAANQQRVYLLFQNFARDQVAHNAMPPDVPGFLDDAWRLQMAGDRTNATKAWVKVEVQLDTWDRTQGRTEPLHSTRALDQLLTGEKDSLPPDDLRIALKQWVEQMERQK